MRRLQIALLLLVVAGTSCQGSAAPSLLEPPGGDIVIGSDLPVSNFFGDGLPTRNAIELAIAQHPTIGHGRFKLAYWSLDDAVAGNDSPEKGIQNVSWMVDVPRVLAMIGPFNSDVAAIAIPVGNKSDLVMVSPSSTRLCLTQLVPTCPYSSATFHPSGHINFFRIAPPDLAQGVAMARYIVDRLSLKRVAVINEWGDDGDIVIQHFKSELERLGGDVVLREDVDVGTADFKDFLSEAHQSHAQAIYALGGFDICAARAQMSDAAVFLGTDGFAGDPDCLGQAGSNTGSIYATKPDVDITASSDPDAIEAVQEFRKAYPHSAIPNYTFAAYDCAQILIAAIEQAVNDAHGNLPNRRQVLDAMARIQFSGVTGTYEFDANGDAKSPLMEMFAVENGQWVNKGKIDASAATS
jgi:branched-chain amino acid transport system substrate-binding protein